MWWLGYLYGEGSLVVNLVGWFFGWVSLFVFEFGFLFGDFDLGGVVGFEFFVLLIVWEDEDVVWMLFVFVLFRDCWFFEFMLVIVGLVEFNIILEGFFFVFVYVFISSIGYFDSNLVILGYS